LNRELLKEQEMSIRETEIDLLFDPDVVQDPQGYYRSLRENDPVHEVPGTGTFLVTRMDLIHDVVARTELFSSVSGEFLHKGDWDVPGLRPASSSYAVEGSFGVLATADPPDHQRQRKVVARKLSANSMRAMEPEFRVLVVDALSNVPADGRLEWMSRVAEPLPMVMVSRILGFPDELAPELKKQGYAMVERISGFVPENRIQQLEDDGINAVGPNQRIPSGPGRETSPLPPQPDGPQAGVTPVAARPQRVEGPSRDDWE
jgi:cytochrome P450